MICKPCACDADEQKFGVEARCDTPCKGHAACKGCDCQHKPVKAGQIVGQSL